MRATAVSHVTPHLLRVVDLANEAEKGVNVSWHVGAAVAKTLSELGQQYNGRELLAAYIEGLDNAAGQAAKGRTEYVHALQAAAAAARR
ncbi:MAG: hypothetical protein ABIO38_03875 [Luteimonas sp.]